MHKIISNIIPQFQKNYNNNLTSWRNYDILFRMNTITSRDNKILKHVKKLGSVSYRAKSREFIAEGERLCNEALACNADISLAIMSETFIDENVNFQKKLDDLKVKVYTVPDKLFDDISKTDTPQGVLFVIKQANGENVNFADISRVLVLDGVAEPGNMGTIIRTAGAFGFSTIILVNSCVDIYNPKVVRSTMGGIFRSDFIRAGCRGEPCSPVDIIETLKSAGFKIIATALKNAVDINTINFDGKIALVIGNEANGVSSELLELSDVNVKIPMANGAESLNAAVAAGIVMYVVGRDALGTPNENSK